jgi:hypothetical protein
MNIKYSPGILRWLVLAVQRPGNVSAGALPLHLRALAFAVAVLAVVASAVLLWQAVDRYLVLRKPGHLYITVVNPSNSSLVLKSVAVEVSRSGSSPPRVLITVANTDTAPHIGVIKAVAYRVGCGEEVVAYGEALVVVPPGRTATIKLELELKQGYSARDINSVVVSLKQIH